MYAVSLFLRMTGNTIKKLCRWGILPVLLLVFCLAIPAAGAGLAVRAFTSESSFSGLTLGVAWNGEDAGNEMAASMLGKMRDVAAYCHVVSFEDPSAGFAALEDGTLDGLLLLPANFAGAVMNDENPDVELYVNEDKPLESLLLIWIGQSATDLLASSQAGIYTTLRIYNDYPSDTLTFNDVLTDINLLFIRNAMNRSQMFRTEKVVATGSLNIAQHYFCSIFCYLLMAFAALYTGHCQAESVRPLGRMAAAGRGSFTCYLSAVAAPWVVLLPLCFVLVLGTRLLGGELGTVRCATGTGLHTILTGGTGNRLGTILEASGSLLKSDGRAILLAVILIDLFICLFAVFCRMLGRSMGGCTIVAFVLAGAMLVFSGGILPPTLLPAWMRRYMDLSPLTTIREWSGTGIDWRGFTGSGTRSVLLLGCWAVVFGLISWFFYDRTMREVAE